MPFSSLKLDPTLLRGVKELGFARPTPIQADAIPPALAGPGRPGLRHDRQRQDRRVPAPDPAPAARTKPRGATRALVLTPTRELAAQILEDLNDLAVHTPLTAAAVFGGVGMGPQEHAFRSGVDVIVATPGRLLDHFQSPYAQARRRSRSWCSTRPTGCSTWASCPTSGGSSRHLPAKRQTLFFSATMPGADRGS